MDCLKQLKCALVCGAGIAALVQPAAAKVFDIPDGDLSAALNTYIRQSGVQLVYMDDAVRGHKSRGAKGDYTETAALSQILRGTGFEAESLASNTIGIVPQGHSPEPIRMAQASRPAAPPPQQSSLETVVVTAQHKSEDIQTVPISITALSQQQLTDRQIAGGPDLLKSVPNMDFTKTNFSGYNIELRGIGTQAISVTTDPAVAVAFNGTPFIRNHFFEQEFYDLGDAEVLLGPQGTLYGRNATAGVVNLKSALPTDTYEAMLSADIGNYSNRRYEGMLNIPIVGDKLDIRFAGEWTKRDGYTIDTDYNTPVDGRDLWSGRVTIGWKPTSDLQTYFVWEHFSEDDDRLRSGKQLCETSQPATSVDGVPVPVIDSEPQNSGANGGGALTLDQNYTSQGCRATSLYAPTAFKVPFGPSLPVVIALGSNALSNPNIDPYAETTQSTNLRQIQSELLPTYRARNDTLELNTTFNVSPSLTLSLATGYNQDFLWSTEDYNRFDTSPGIFSGPELGTTTGSPAHSQYYQTSPTGLTEFCDPQLGCSDRLVGQDLDEEHSWQISEELRLASNFSGPLNFSFGGNYLHYETVERYYVFYNALTDVAQSLDAFGTSSTADNSDCLQSGFSVWTGGWQNLNPKVGGGVPSNGQICVFVDTNPIGALNNKGHNYFLSENPYVLNSYAGFGEAYYDITPDLKLTTGFRYTIDEKHFVDIPSEVLTQGIGYPVTGIVNQTWDRLSGRSVLDWSPKLDFTDQTLLYASYAHGYKAGGANPPGAELGTFGAADLAMPDHPLTFKPEYIEAFELGTKNTLLDSSLTLNGDIFYYNYTGYQISEIVDRTAINNNYNAHVEGAELTANWEPVPGLKFNFAGGWEDTVAAGGTRGIDLMDRTAGMPGWMVIKPFATDASNCILPDYVVAALLTEQTTAPINQYGQKPQGGVGPFACQIAYQVHNDPVSDLPYVANPTGFSVPTAQQNGITVAAPIPAGYPGFNPNNPLFNDGEGFAKNLSGHALPNAPPLTVSLGGEYSMPVSEDWVATARADFYWQADSWARIFNDNPYDRIRGYDTLNLSLILNSANGWSVMAYVKNVFDVTAITGDFLNSDDSGLTTNVFLTDPRLFGVRVTKQLDESDGFWGSDYNGADFFTSLFSDKDGGTPPLWIELGGEAQHVSGQGAAFAPAFLAANKSASIIFDGTSPTGAQRPPLFDFGEDAKVTFQPDGSDWVVSAAVRFGRAGGHKEIDHQTNGVFYEEYIDGVHYSGPPLGGGGPHGVDRFSDTIVDRSDSHAIIDFMAGKDVGLGIFGSEGSSSVISAGLRFTQFANHSTVSMRARPDFNIHYLTVPGNYDPFVPGQPVVFKFRYFHTYHATGGTSRKFHGIGPSISWAGSVPVAGDGSDTALTLDWGANGALLFGRQRTAAHHQESAHYQTESFWVGGAYQAPAYVHPQQTRRLNKSVAVPNVGGFAGISWRYNNAKVSFGYRADLFFGAIDGGIDKRKSETLNMGGPFATISLGLGG